MPKIVYSSIHNKLHLKWFCYLLNTRSSRPFHKILDVQVNRQIKGSYKTIMKYSILLFSEDISDKAVEVTSTNS